mmetsp:Transcript_11015/g.28449  ORF Transcript_11015/g.28449 Transcript_11015/m.28449 type:complete len:93 (-) Transcript_11015:23-301(-)
MRNQSSQSFTLSLLQNETRIVRQDFPGGNDKCNTLSEIVDYNIQEVCYPLFSSKVPRSFRWVAHRQVTSAISGCQRVVLMRCAWLALFFAAS